MYPKALLVALLSLSLGVSAIPKGNKGQSASSSSVAADTCATGAAVKTVTVTQTAGAAASTSTAVLAANPNAGKGGAKGGAGNTKGAGAGNTKGTGAAGATGAGNTKGTGAAGNTGAAAGTAGNTGAATGTAGTTGKGGNNASTGAATGNKGNTGTAGNTGTGNAGTSDAQTSLTIDPSNIFTFTQTGQETPTAGQEASLTSTNNFINFCLQFPDKQKTNGQQITDGSCNQTPMGVIAAQSKMPSAKFQNPVNGGTVAANQNFTIQLAIKNLETGHFTNPATTFHMAPQVVNAQGLIKGHSHVVIEKLTSLDQKEPTDPTAFVFFKGLNDVAQNGILSTVVDGGLPEGTYRIATINSSANHQPALVAVAQRGALDDMAYFTVTANGAAAGGNAGTAAGAKGANGQAAAGTSTQAAAGAKGTTAAGQNGQTAAKGNKNAAAAAAAAGNRKTGAKNRRRF
ncbi:hypothetical protein C8T65DRAFT_698424 [Cerioporus squamosus]|nr:hypothetical protein C8T65DRAFT_698424 [Cerioporus squamosus]